MARLCVLVLGGVVAVLFMRLGPSDMGPAHHLATGKLQTWQCKPGAFGLLPKKSGISAQYGKHGKVQVLI